MYHPPAGIDTVEEQSGFTRAPSCSTHSDPARQGYIQIYCGTGKGKTTAALGLSMRILLSGGSVFFAQFCKGIETAELKLCSWCDQFVIEQYGTGFFIVGSPNPEEYPPYFLEGFPFAGNQVTDRIIT